MRQKLIPILFAAVASVGPAFAADVAAPETSVDWTGFYVGASGVFGNFEVDYSDPYDGHIGDRMSEADSDDFSGAGIGAQLGYLHQFGSIVVGGEVFADWNNAEGCVVAEESDSSGCPYGHSIETEVEHSIGVNGKLGFASGPMMFYGLAGLSWSDVKSTYNDWTFGGDDDAYDSEFDTIDTNSENVFGLRLGAGAEFMVTESVSIFAQGSYTSLNTEFLAKNLSDNEPEDTGLESDIGLMQANVGVNFHF